MHAAARVFLFIVTAASFGAQGVCFKAKDKDFAQVQGHNDRAAKLYLNVSEREEELDQILLAGPATNVLTTIACDDTKIPTSCQIMGDQGSLRVQKNAGGTVQLILRRYALSLRADESGDLHMGTVRIRDNAVQVHELEELTSAQCDELFKPPVLEYPAPSNGAPADSQR